ncbi:MAG TPA: 2,3-bisphosphoglycerate-independent phosphoglycerate mutase [Actinomycetota bacterium]|nr:2,3-bisphosphoglycerate-independent phosphoglycerate mutase [Actinomycetota bacterium]
MTVEHEELLAKLLVRNESKIVLIVLDGLGGMQTSGVSTELHAAASPHLDGLARDGSSGLATIVRPGITPGSGAGHLSLFGYDPLQYELGRGALSAAGIGFELKPGDIAARVNFCTLDERGVIVDRRAGRIPTETNKKLCKKILEEADLGEGVEIFLETEREHRALLVLRGEGLAPAVADTDPQIEGVVPFEPQGTSANGDVTAALLKKLLTQVRTVLAGEAANFILLRGLDTHRELPAFGERYGLRPAAIAGYPMYIGIARLLGMDVFGPKSSWTEEVDELEKAWEAHDFFYIHQKRTDSAGEDGDFDGKVNAIEEVDATIPRILELGPDVICVTGDHATPSQLMQHSWHPVPFLLWGERVGVDHLKVFSEESARGGGLGWVKGTDLMPLMLAAAARLLKYGA